jgi:hypothetical protein
MAEDTHDTVSGLSSRQRPARGLASAVPLLLAGLVFVGAVDLWVGRTISAPLYMPLIAGAAWARGMGGAVFVAVAATLARAGLDTIGPVDEAAAAAGWQAFARLTIYLVVGIAIARLRDVIDQRDLLVGQLRAALAEVSALRGLLPVCAWCKKIRDDQRGGEWVPFEHYLTRRTPTKITHGICPACAKQQLHGALARR